MGTLVAVVHFDYKMYFIFNIFSFPGYILSSWTVPKDLKENIEFSENAVPVCLPDDYTKDVNALKLGTLAEVIARQLFRRYNIQALFYR